MMSNNKDNKNASNNNDNNHNKNYMFQHLLLGVCGTSPISPGKLVLSVAIWTPDVQLLMSKGHNKVST